MKKVLYSIITISFFIFLLVNILYNPTTVNISIKDAINMFINNIFPSVFCMFLISSMLISIGIPKFIGNIFNSIFYKLFKIKKEGSFIFFMSLFSGSPSNAKFINELMDNHVINIKEGEKLLFFTSLNNPLFVINTVGIIILKDIKLGYLILAINIISNILIGIIFRNYYISKVERNTNLINSLKQLNNNINNTNVFKTLYKATKDAFLSLINIFTIICIFVLITNLLNLNMTKPINILIIGLLEMTSGLKYLSNINNNFLKLVLSTIFLSFNGFCIHLQTLNMLNEKKIKYIYFLLSKILNVIISLIILFILSLFFL